jgi:methionyl-tRNA synthetase
MKFKKFYVTTPIYYVNDVPHIGHAYTTIAADILARWHRVLGDNVFFLTGLDENSTKTVKAAKEEIAVGGLERVDEIKIKLEDIQHYVNSMSKKWENVWNVLKISNDDFIRTTEDRHKKLVIEFFKKVFDKGDIYKGSYEGLYCDDCEQFYTEKDLENGLCPFHKKAPRKITEENYFFKLSKYQKILIEHIEKNPDFIRPETRRNEVLSFLREGLQDVSISRPNLEWGIDLPIDSKHKFWVWFDALLNYISADPSKWPADVQLMAKDILRFHCIIWPAMLKSAGYELPKTIFVHGFFTIEGQKISKSLGNVIDPIKLSEKYSVDALRYFLFREVPFGQDGDFSEKSLTNRYNSELADTLGNLVNRVLVLVEKNFDGNVPESSKKDRLTELALDTPKKVSSSMENFQFHNALNDIWYLISESNKYINENKVWEIKDKQKLGGILYNLLETLRFVSILIYPFIPETAEKIIEQLGLEKKFSFEDLKWGLLKEGTKIKRDHVLFDKIKV